MKKRREVTKKDVRDWVTLYEIHNHSVQRIAQKYHRNHHVVYRHLLKEGVQMRNNSSGPPVTMRERREWTDLFLQGENPSDFAGDRNLNTVYKHIAFELRERIEDKKT